LYKTNISQGLLTKPINNS